MLKNRDLYDEIKKIDEVIEKSKDEVEILRAILKANELALKLLHNIRTNQTRLLNKMGVELVSKEKDEKEK